MSRFRLSEDAEADLVDILDYVAASNPREAARLGDRFTERFRGLAAMPGIGRPREEYGPGFRSSHVAKYLIFYVEEPDGILILRVVHGHRDLSSVFGPDDHPPRP